MHGDIDTTLQDTVPDPSRALNIEVVYMSFDCLYLQFDQGSRGRGKIPGPVVRWPKSAKETLPNERGGLPLARARQAGIRISQDDDNTCMIPLR